jgi:hypothetical protein
MGERGGQVIGEALVTWQSLFVIGITSVGALVCGVIAGVTLLGGWEASSTYFSHPSPRKDTGPDV